MPMSIQEAYGTPNTLKQKPNSSHHIIIKTPNALRKERILNEVRGKGQITYKGRPIRIIPDFSPETMKGRRSLIDVIKTLREHKCQPSSICNKESGVPGSCYPTNLLNGREKRRPETPGAFSLCFSYQLHFHQIFFFLMEPILLSFNFKTLKCPLCNSRGFHPLFLLTETYKLK